MGTFVTSLFTIISIYYYLVIVKINHKVFLCKQTIKGIIIWPQETKINKYYITVCSQTTTKCSNKGIFTQPYCYIIYFFSLFTIYLIRIV